MDEKTPLVVIGAGNMARAILDGAAAAGVVGGEVAVVDPDPTKRAAFAQSFESASDAMRWLRDLEPAAGVGQVMLAVKPQMLGTVGDQIRPLLAEDKAERIVVSILAGTPSALVRRAVGPARVARAMPNLPARVGRGVTAIALGAGTRQGDEAFALRLFEGVGRVEVIAESMMDAFTAVAGSGPAYVFYLAEAMIDAAVELGFDHEQAVRIVRDVVSGSGELLAQSGDAPRAMRAAVTSKGGTTAAATGVLDQRGVMSAAVDAIRAARDRGSTLARGE